MKSLVKTAVNLLIGTAAIIGILLSDNIYCLFAIPMVASMLIALVDEI